MDLRYQQQHCELTLRQGLAEYHRYLAAIGRKAMVDRASSRLILEHDVTPRDIRHGYVTRAGGWLGHLAAVRVSRSGAISVAHARLPDIKALYRALISEKGWLLFPMLYWKCLGLKWRIIRRTRRMSKKWPFQFPEEWLDQPVAALRAQHGISILTIKERETGELLTWSGQY